MKTRPVASESNAQGTCSLGVVGALLLTALAAGCGSAVSSGHNTALNSVDLVKMTDQMATSLATDPRVNQEIADNGPLTIVCEPVENELTGEIIPRGQAEAYTARVRDLLSQKAPDRFTWIMNRDEFYDLRQQELQGVSLGPSPDAVQPKYALHAVFQSLTQEDSEHRSSYYLCVYRLTDLQDRVELWSARYEVKKTEVKGFLD
jgi:peptidoglycan-synthase activator LpoB